jgi:hypothetical protein
MAEGQLEYLVTEGLSAAPAVGIMALFYQVQKYNFATGANTARNPPVKTANGNIPQDVMNAIQDVNNKINQNLAQAGQSLADQTQQVDANIANNLNSIVRQVADVNTAISSDLATIARWLGLG